MQAHITTVCFQGMKAIPVDVQAQLAPGLPAFHLVGLPDKAVAESKERVRAALYSMGLALPAKRITINLAPADLRKEGSHYDLPIALVLMGAIGAQSPTLLDSFLAMGELALDGSLVPVGGGLAAALCASSHSRGLICSVKDGSEAAWAGSLPIVAAKSLLEVSNHLKGTHAIPSPRPRLHPKPAMTKDMSEIQGQDGAKRALLLAAAGGHNMLMIGPPGVGKSMLAERLPGLLPPLTPAEALEVTTIHSLGGQLKAGTLLQNRPFRAPHHSASVAALVGGGLKAMPGEISLAHSGILFLDELPEFGRAHLEALRQPLESGLAVIARANQHVTYPADFQLVAAMNPCPCGQLGHPRLQCRKAPRCGETYQSKLSAPLLDRLDIQLHVENVTAAHLEKRTPSPSSEILQKKVATAWIKQQKRHASKDEELSTMFAVPDATDVNESKQRGFFAFLNGRVPWSRLEPHLHVTTDAQALLKKASEQWILSVRGHHKVLRLARTLADLEDSDTINKIHVAEALSYRAWSSRHRGAA